METARLCLSESTKKLIRGWETGDAIASQPALHDSPVHDRDRRRGLSAGIAAVYDGSRAVPGVLGGSAHNPALASCFDRTDFRSALPGMLALGAAAAGRHRRYYRCTACRARVKRYWFGPWLDASGPEDAARYRKPTDAGTWTEFAVSEHLDNSTSGQLLKNKRSGPQPDDKARRPIYTPKPNPRLEEARAKVRGFFERLNQIKK
jgi:hypothetical protein